jgi:light-regulated signal transduction histidine kinase (bacteriophytochrome)
METSGRRSPRRRCSTLLNGYEFDYGEEIKAVLKLLAVMERLVDDAETIAYLEATTAELDVTVQQPLDALLRALVDESTTDDPSEGESD